MLKTLTLLILTAIVMASVACGSTPSSPTPAQPKSTPDMHNLPYNTPTLTLLEGIKESYDEEKCNQAKKEWIETLSGDSQEKMERAYYKAEEVCLDMEGNTK